MPFLEAERERTWIIPTNAAFERHSQRRLRELHSVRHRDRLRRELMGGALDRPYAPSRLRSLTARPLRSTLGSSVRLSRDGVQVELNHGAKVSIKGTRVANGWVYQTNIALPKPDRRGSPGLVDPMSPPESKADGLRPGPSRSSERCGSVCLAGRAA